MSRRYVVIGNPVAHSLSPRIHRLFARAAGHAISYETLLAPAFRPAAERFFAAPDSGGANVTLPFKLDAYAWAAERGSTTVNADEAGAVNAILATSRGPRGDNTDGVGLLRDLQQNLSLPLAGKAVLLLGAGGAARGVLGPLLRAGPRRLTLANRTAERAQELAKAFDGVEPMSLAAVRGGYDVVINATSASALGDGLALPEAAIEGAFCYDMFYRLEADTAFCSWCRERGAAGVADGLGMLIEQAAESYLLWRGVRPDTASVAAALAHG